MGNCISCCLQLRFKKPKLKWPLGKQELNSTTLIVPTAFRRYFPKKKLDTGRYGCFLPIFSTICFDKLPEYMLSLRKEHLGSRGSLGSNAASPTFEPIVQTPALFGSIHVAFVVVFPDGLRWLLKIPANGYVDQYTELEAESLEAEALTMQLLKRETTIPIPQVYAFDHSFENPLGCPFILMEYVSGTSLTHTWLDESIARDSLEKRREKILHDLAYAMQQLNKFTSPQGGSPLFDDQKKLKGVGPRKGFHYEACWEDGSLPAVFHKTGPFTNASSFVSSLLPDIDMAPDDGYKNIRRLLLRFIDWIPNSAVGEINDQSFVLTHADFDLQNILVSPDGHLISIIDWDGVVFAPRCLGNERYPNWLISDWNPFFYRYLNANHPDFVPLSASDCDSPDDLSRYRAMYENFVTEASSSSTPSQSSLSQTLQQSPIQLWTAAKVARNSLLINTLKTACDRYYCTAEIVAKIYDEIVNVQTQGEYKNSKALDLRDRRKVWNVVDILQHEADALLEQEVEEWRKKQEKKEKVDKGGEGEEEENREDVGDGKIKKSENEDQEACNDSGIGTDDVEDDEGSEEDEEKAFNKKLFGWVKEGFQALFV